MPRRRLALALLVAPLLAAASASAAHAQPARYTFSGTFTFAAPVTVDFVVETPSPIAAAGDFAPVSCTTSDPGTACAATMRFDPDGFSTGRTFVGLNTVGGTAFYFFDAGALLVDGTYAVLPGGFPGIDPGTGDPGFYGSAGNATLTVAIGVTAVPEPATVALLGGGLLALAAIAGRARRRTASGG